MYSIVLAAALTTGAATPAWGWGGCHGGGCYGCWGCRGCWGGCYGCYGCCGGCYGYWGGYYGGGVSAAAYAYPTTAPAVAEVLPTNASVQVQPAAATTQATATARITVRLPAEAKLFVDGVPCPLTSDLRSFESPQLPMGKEFYYTLKADLVRNGQSYSESRRVTFAAESNVSVTFGNLQPLRTASR